mgnify:CR=1 FL=1
MAENSFKLGLSTKPWGKNNGPYRPFAFKDATGCWGAASVASKHKALWDAASALSEPRRSGGIWRHLAASGGISRDLGGSRMT